MKKLSKKILIGVFSIILLVGCEDKKDATESNFKEVINNKLSKECIQFGLFEFPIKITKNSFFNNKDKLDTLVDIGFVTSSNVKVEDKFSFGIEKKIVDGIEYSLTDLGEKSVVYQGKQSKLCAGKYRVKSIENFTEPADMLGAKFIRVIYKKEAADVPHWAHELIKQKSFETYSKFISKEIQNDKIELILTNDGWIPAKDFK